MVPGIDAGDYHFKTAVPDSAGSPKLITNRFGEPFTRSVVYFADDGSTIVGTEAENAALADPERAVFDWKRHMGTDEILYEDKKGRIYIARDILAILLEEVKEDIEAKTGEVCEAVVITVPANYTDKQKQETKDAAATVGLKVVHLPKEPTAAALGNEFYKRKDSRVLVFDLGGGTFDVSILERRGNRCEVIATNGDNKLGAIDFNSALAEMILEQWETEHGCRPQPDDQIIFYQDLSQRVEQLKLALTVQSQSQLVISCDGDTLKAVVTRDQFNERVLPLVGRAMKKTEKTATDANLGWDDIDEIYAVGGGSLPPIVREELEKLTGKKISRRCEAHSAAAFGAVIDGRLEAARKGEDYRIIGGTLPPLDFYLREILSRSIGVAVLDENDKELCSEILVKNTPIPSIQARMYKMSMPNQTDVLIRVLDGEDGADADKCVELGRFELKGLPVRPDLIGRVEITFNLDRNGMLTATAGDTVSGKTSNLEITYDNKANAA
jgi:molecular chaperone DnaK